MLSVKQAAELLGVSTSRVRALAASGQLKGRKIGKGWILERESVFQRLSDKPTAGRPKYKSISEGSLSMEEPTDQDDFIAHGHKIYNECKEFFRYRPDAIQLKEARSKEEAAFYIAIADFFLQQEQHALIEQGVF